MAVEEKSNKKVNFNKIVQDVVVFSRKVNTLGKFLDFTLGEVMPKVFDNVEEVYASSKKQLDYFFRHLA
jgi:hypothetical protein